jgi:hypothetical protein
MFEECELRRVSTCLDHLQGITEYHSSIHNNLDGLLNTLEFMHETSLDITKFVCSSVELVHKMRRM